MAASLLFTATFFLMYALLTVAVESPGDVDIEAVLNQVMEMKAEVEKLKSAQRVTSVESRATPEEANEVENLRNDDIKALWNKFKELEAEVHLMKSSARLLPVNRGSPEEAEMENGGLSAEFKQIRSELDRLKAAPKTRRSAASGYAAGAQHNQGGGGSNFLCLHETPQWNKYFPGVFGWAGMIYGVEYEMWDPNESHVFSTINNGGSLLHDYPSPCVACFAPHTSTVMMIPARTQCPAGWNLEYHGYIVSEATNNIQSRHRSQYACWDHAPEFKLPSGEPARIKMSSTLSRLDADHFRVPDTRPAGSWHVSYAQDKKLSK